ncbi:Crp/Fnr family transcriptional regulator [Pelagerythrobacter rhizovicinus]|uniref:Crp/Fnr family transcriptional regulator n=1 Tax=Pelagerythrobacter rhizovicinus TaxID=2268576 RepID=A0A4V1QWM9_9SPHN|nr:Crp/Fnr family transcriptional regulator [Pelagerythrobacter rhizovicinus]RXZ66716.1 Crp/Fnr family transcriptional regulator [Pelagerythrobacter rhizovicinus]
MPPHGSTNLLPFLNRLLKRSLLSDREQGEILDLPVRVKQAQPNEDFVGLGEKVDHACFVLEGLVGRFDQNSRGDRQITALYIPGDMPDLHSVVQPTATSALQALSTSIVLAIPHAALREASRQHPAIAEAFWRDCMVDSMVLAQWVVNVGRRDAKSRVAHLLCEMARRYGVAPTAGRLVFHLPMTQWQLADAAGLTPVHVNRTLKALANIGTSFRMKMVQIDDWAALVELGDFDPTYLQDEMEPEERIRIVQ